MKKLWDHISNAGISGSKTTTESRSIVLSNQLSVVFTILSFCLLIMVWTEFSITTTTPVILLMSLLFLSIPFLNNWGYTNVSRLMLSNSVPVFALIIGLMPKFSGNPTEVFEYFDSRIVIIISSVIPAIIFSIEEKSKLIISLLICFITLVLFDPIHNLLGVGFYQKGFESPHYEFINFISVISFAILVGSVTFLKSIIRNYEKEKERLIVQLNDQNQELMNQNREILEQRKELIVAKNMIEEQKIELSETNKELELLIDEKTQDLIDTNKELAQNINELQQFSYTISHNLRAPVASLIGLANIFDQESLHEENKIILNHMRKSAESLDKVFRDLNKVLELRNTVASVKEKVILSSEINEIKNALANEIETREIRIVEKYDLDVIFTVRPFINSILYNLISNAIKYRHRRRKSFVRIYSTRTHDNVVITVEDNGLGMDIERYRRDIYKMYKRFHEHTEGKGLGLYLVKLQTEALGGTINVESKVNEGAKFTVTIKFLEDIHNQTIMENDSCRIYFDAFSNITGIIWKQKATSDQFREAILKSLEILRQYNTPNMIIDMKKTACPEQPDVQWFLQSYLTEAVDYGLIKLAFLTKPGKPIKEMTDFQTIIADFLAKFGNNFSSFQSADEAKDWIAENQ